MLKKRFAGFVLQQTGINVHPHVQLSCTGVLASRFVMDHMVGAWLGCCVLQYSQGVQYPSQLKVKRKHLEVDLVPLNSISTCGKNCIVVQHCRVSTKRNTCVARVPSHGQRGRVTSYGERHTSTIPKYFNTIAIAVRPCMVC